MTWICGSCMGGMQLKIGQIADERSPAVVVIVILCVRVCEFSQFLYTQCHACRLLQLAVSQYACTYIGQIGHLICTTVYSNDILANC